MEAWLAAAVLVKALFSVTTCCWLTVPVPSAPTVMSNARFCQKTLLYRAGYEILVQAPLVALVPGG